MFSTKYTMWKACQVELYGFIELLHSNCEGYNLHHALSLVYVLQTNGFFWSFPYFDEIMAIYFAYTIRE